MIKLVVITCLSLSLVHAESSMFGAGDINTQTPYGLNGSEKEILKNRKLINKQSRDIANLRAENAALKESIEGVHSIIQGIGRKVSGRVIEKNSADIEHIHTQIDAKAKSDAENYESTKQILLELTSLVDGINNTYVQKKELKKFKKEIISLLSKLKTGINSSNSKPKAVDYTKMKSDKLLTTARANFKAKSYDKAELGFKELVKRDFKLALASFYLGELNYYQGYYGASIEYFKNSASKKQTSSYTPTLLLHTANAFKKIGDKENALTFFNALISQYPDASESETAKKLKKGIE